MVCLSPAPGKSAAAKAPVSGGGALAERSAAQFRQGARCNPPRDIGLLAGVEAELRQPGGQPHSADQQHELPAHVTVLADRAGAATGDSTQQGTFG